MRESTLTVSLSALKCPVVVVMLPLLNGHLSQSTVEKQLLDPVDVFH